MPAINFASQFAAQVARGDKRQTIRAGRRFKLGDRLYLYTGQRTNSCKKLGEFTATQVQTIRIELGRVILGDRRLGPEQITQLALDDGFDSTHGFFAYFRKAGLPFTGQLVKW